MYGGAVWDGKVVSRGLGLGAFGRSGQVGQAQFGEARQRRYNLALPFALSKRSRPSDITRGVVREVYCPRPTRRSPQVVILALHEKQHSSRSHVPYRNSLLTSVLRDSLGGNCKTVMVATIHSAAPHTDESISTCRFAQRVAQIKNEVTRVTRRCSEL